jgi:hypothetical protein
MRKTTELTPTPGQQIIGVILSPYTITPCSSNKVFRFSSKPGKINGRNGSPASAAAYANSGHFQHDILLAQGSRRQ